MATPLITRKTSLSSLVILAWILASLPAALQAQTWKWIDSSGRITWSDRPPPQDIPAKSILSQPPAVERRAMAAKAAPVATRAPAQDTKDADGKPELSPQAKWAEVKAKKAAEEAKEEATAKKKAEEEQRAAILKDNCTRARSNALALESGQRLARPNEKGEPIVLDDAMRAAELRRAREAIEKNCNG